MFYDITCDLYWCASNRIFVSGSVIKHNALLHNKDNGLPSSDTSHSVLFPGLLTVSEYVTKSIQSVDSSIL